MGIFISEEHQSWLNAIRVIFDLDDLDSEEIVKMTWIIAYEAGIMSERLNPRQEESEV